MIRFATVFMVLGLAVDSATAGLLAFDLRDTTATAEIESGVITRGGITATLTPNQGALNQTGSSFGINSAGADDSDGLDDEQGTESISITFSEPILLADLTLSIFSAGEQATLTINSFAPLPLTDTGSGTDVFMFTSNNFVGAGESITLTHSLGNGFSFNAFTISNIVPEPNAVVLGLLGAAIACCGWRPLRRYFR